MTTRFVPYLLRTASATTRRPLPLPSVLSSRTFVSATSPMLEKKVIKVPTMGDSITEGTIVEWTVQVGQKVKDGDVVALIETDKVTVDIKANMNGVISQQFGAVDDTVEVGSQLYELDTEAEATVEASDAPVPAASEPKKDKESEPSPAPSKKVAPTPASEKPPKPSTQHRTPSIHFLGKEGWKTKLAGTPELPPVPPNYGRPAFSEEEMEALMTGGANLAPNVKKHSAGAIFGY